MRWWLVVAAMLAASRMAVAQNTIALEIRAELVRETQRLGEIMRHNVEAVTVESDGMRAVALDAAMPDELDGVMVPFALDGQDGGNVFQEYVALFQRLTPDTERQTDFNVPDGHMDIALLGFERVNNVEWGLVDWPKALVSGQDILVPAHERGCVQYRCCTNELGSITVHVSNNAFGPNLRITGHPDPAYVGKPPDGAVSCTP